MDFGHTSDPYCKLHLYPSTDVNNKYVFKTTVKKHTLNPEYNEEFVFSHMQLQDLIGKTLRITVYDKDMGKKDDYIGKYSRDRGNEKLQSSNLTEGLGEIIELHACVTSSNLLRAERENGIYSSLIFHRDQLQNNEKNFYSFLGGFELGQSASGDELKHWLLMVKAPEQWIDMWHKLKAENFPTSLRQRDSHGSR